jgi:hypothetical protein
MRWTSFMHDVVFTQRPFLQGCGSGNSRARWPRTAGYPGSEPSVRVRQQGDARVVHRPDECVAFPRANPIATNAGSDVRIVYHGTRQESAEAIAEIGLVVPGQGNGVTVANGSSYGVGIYTAESCETPVGYAFQGDLFVCLGNVTKTRGCTNPLGDWRIFTDRELVTPIIRLKFTPGESNNEPDGRGGRRFCPPEVVA